ncbi:MAG: NADPH-dependent F420 reductase [Bacteroidetes bacterium]|nr:MAG: NADPH-dependent F420 reductase [Bacteroidota bacterium]
MNIAVIGTGNVGGTLARKWAEKGHTVRLGVKDTESFKGIDLLQTANISAHTVADAVAQSDVILIAVPAPAAAEVAQSLGNTDSKVIIDAMNIVMGRGPVGYQTTAEAILANTQTNEVVKCFNTTGFNNMEDPVYNGVAIDLFMAGDSQKGKQVARQLAMDAGFAECYDIGGNDRFQLMEQFAWFWINMAMFQGHGRNIGFKLLKR